MSYRLLAAAPLAALFLASCGTTYQNINSPDPAFGEATKYNAAIQIIDPDPVYDQRGSQPGDSGAKGAEAVKRYRTDRVKDVEEITTTGTASGPQ